MSLYQQYRPKTFADVCGQDAIVQTLTEAIKQDKIAHAYLFAGTRGTGKTSVARILARALLTKGIADDIIRKNILQAIDDGSLTDLTEIDAASNTGVDNIRDLIEKIQFTPIVAGAKVYIIDEVHMLSKGAFNALLKTLEEPPAYAYFILATTELHKIPATIQSRCQRFLFRQINEEDIIKRLQFIADSERITVEHAALRAIAHASGGSMRDAVSLLDQLRSIPTITLQDVKERIGETGHEYVEQVLAAIDSNDREAIISIVRRMEEAAVPMETFTRLLLTDVRTRLHTSIEEKHNPAALLALLDRLMETIKNIRIAPLPALALESALLSLLGTHTSDTSTQKVTPTPNVIDTKPLSKPVEVTPPEKTADIQNIQMEATVLTPEITIESIVKEWPKIVEQTEPPFVRMSLKNGQVQSIDGNTITIRFGSAFHRDKVSSADGRSIETILEKTFKKPLRLKCILEADSVVAPSNAGNVNIADAVGEIF